MADVDLKLRAENRALARRIDALESMVKDLALTSQLSRSTVEIEGSPMPLPRAVAAGVDARTVAERALVSANGKNRNAYEDFEPNTTDGFSEGDNWFKKNEAGTAYTRSWRLQDGIWVEFTVEGTAITNLDAGSITSGTINAIDIVGSTISAARMDAVNFTGAYLSVRPTPGDDYLALGNSSMAWYRPDSIPTVRDNKGSLTFWNATATPGGSSDPEHFAMQLSCRRYVGNVATISRVRIGDWAYENGKQNPLSYAPGLFDLPVDLQARRMFANTFWAPNVYAQNSRSNSYLNETGQKAAPFAIAAGRENMGNVPGNSTRTLQVNFPSSTRFTLIPIISLSAVSSTRFRVTAFERTSNGFLLTAVNDTGGDSTCTVEWIAVQMNPDFSPG